MTMRSYRLLLALAACLAACTPADSGMDDDLPEGSGATRLQAEFVDGLILVEAAIGGTQGWWVLDSGYDYSLIDSTAATVAGLRLSEMETVPQPGGSVSQQWSESATLSFPSGSWEADSLAAMDFSGLAPMVGLPVAGLLGHDFFLDHVVTIDYESGVLSVASPDSYRAPEGATEVTVWIEDGEPFALGFLWADGRSVPAKLKIDSGSMSGLGLNGSFVAQNRLIPAEWPRTAVGGVAVGGSTRNFVARLDSMSFGDRLIRDPVVAWSEDLERIGDAGTLGAPVLGLFRVTFDYHRMRMLLEPVPEIDETGMWDAAGVLVVQPPGGDVMVAMILPDSPAEQAGLAPGDVIEKIGSRVAADMGLGAVRSYFKQPGVVDTLTVLRGDDVLHPVVVQRPLP